MTMRATVTRNAAAGENAWGNEEKPDYSGSPVAVRVPCFVWSKLRRMLDDDGKQGMAEELMAVAPSDANLQESDQLSIADRRGKILFGGPLFVEAIATKHGPSPSRSHLSLSLRRHL